MTTMWTARRICTFLLSPACAARVQTQTHRTRRIAALVLVPTTTGCLCSACRRVFHSSCVLPVSHPLPLSELSCISPIDGRYGSVTSPLRSVFSEYGLIQQRVKVEIRWLQMLARHPDITELSDFSPHAHSLCDAVIQEFSLLDAQRVKSIESTTKHDMKAVEYWLKERLSAYTELAAASEFIHFACTSEDINNLSYALMMKEAQSSIMLPMMDTLINTLTSMSHQYADIPMLSRTHGQAATPTTIGKELSNFTHRLRVQRHQFSMVKIQGKMNGAVGNYNAHIVAYPEVDWIELTKEFVQDTLGLTFNPYTTQIEPHDYMAELFHSLCRFNSILLDMNRDLWGYISLGYFKQRVIEGEVGSSTMPHKINPIDFENSEGNLGVSNALLEHLASKLCISRFQRDLSDSTVLRSIGICFSHAYLAYSNTLKGLSKLSVDQVRLVDEVCQMWEVLGEAYQTVMRRYGVEKPYEKLKTLTRGKKLDRETMLSFVNTLDIPEQAKQELLQLTPEKYIGLAAQLAKAV